MEFTNYKIEQIISDISMGPFGSDVKKDVYVDSGVPILNGSNLQGFKLQEDSFGYLTEEKADTLKKSNAKRGDVIVTHRGTLGQIVYVPDNSKYERYVISQSQFRFTCKKEIVRPDYITYYFHTPIGQYKLLSNASQVGVPALARATSTFRNLDVDLPSIECQNRIMDILSSLDRKIETNNKINAILEDMAQAIFKDWFVDFTPFKNEKFVDSELGKIPEGWRVGTLSDICEYSKRRIAVSSLTMATYFSTENMLSNKEGTTMANSLPNTEWTTGCMEYDVLISNIRPYFKKIHRVEEPCGCSADVMCFHPKGSKFYSYMYRLLYDDVFFEYIMSSSKGTKMPRGDKKMIMKYPILIPTDDVLVRFSILTYNIFEKVKLNKTENQRLASLRDTLLPKLMSGEIEV